MPLVHRLLVTLRTLMEEEPEPLPRSRRRRSTIGNKTSSRNKQTTALIITFRDLFRSGGMNIILDEIESNRRSSRKGSCVPSPGRKSTINESDLCVANRPRFASDSSILLMKDPNDPTVTSTKLVHQDESIPLLHEETISAICTDIVVPRPIPIFPGGFFRCFFLSRRSRQQQAKDLTVPLNPEDENKTVETLRKVLKWSPRKQNSAKFAVSLPTDEKHTALAVVENAVNRVKEEQLCKKKKKFFWLKLC